MKEKATRKRRKIDIFTLENSEILLDQSEDLYIFGIIDSQSHSEGEIDLRVTFNRSDISSDVLMRLVLDYPARIKVKIIIKAEQGNHGIVSTLDMNALLLHPESSIEFVPSLEIDEMDVSVDHRSTLGHPDQEIVAYLKSRGLSDTQIKGLLAEGFFAIMN